MAGDVLYLLMKKVTMMGNDDDDDAADAADDAGPSLRTFFEGHYLKVIIRRSLFGEYYLKLFRLWSFQSRSLFEGHFNQGHFGKITVGRCWRRNDNIIDV